MYGVYRLRTQRSSPKWMCHNIKEGCTIDWIRTVGALHRKEIIQMKFAETRTFEWTICVADRIRYERVYLKGCFEGNRSSTEIDR